MTTDLDTLLTALYVLVDDHVIPPAPRRPGHPKQLSDAELVCLVAAQVLLGARSEHHWLRICYGRLGHLFPYLPNQPGYNKRVKAAAPLIGKTMPRTRDLIRCRTTAACDAPDHHHGQRRRAGYG